MAGHSKTQALHERACLHRTEGRAGAFYTGKQFVAALYRLRGEAGLTLARKVQSFFWADAALVSVWLCSDCASEAGLDLKTRKLDAA